MADEQQPGQDPQQPRNPFEELFNMLSGQGSSEEMQGLMAAMQSMMSSFTQPGATEGSGVQWAGAKDLARRVVASKGDDPVPTSLDRSRVVDAVSLAEQWLDAATDFPRLTHSPAAWSRAEWIENTMPVWRQLVEPVATSIADAMVDAMTSHSEDLGPMAGLQEMLSPALRASGGQMFGMQLGQALGQLAAEVLGSTDIGLPLDSHGSQQGVALIPTNVSAFADGLDQSADDVLLYIALRESARQRLFHAAGWLGPQLLALVEQYARGISIDTSALEEAAGQLEGILDVAALESLSDQLQTSLFTPHRSAEQQAVLARLETLLALVEGWVDDVVSEATRQWMPAAGPLAEVMRRRRASGGPAENTFATLVGLELRPRRMRDAANLWAAVRQARGAVGRDALWSHPDVIPTTSDLDDPIGFVSGDTTVDSQSDAFDDELQKLIDDVRGEEDNT